MKILQRALGWRRRPSLRHIEDVEGYASSAREASLESKAEKSATYYAVFSIQGMSCSSCVGSIRRGLDDLNFVKAVNINIIALCGRITFLGPEENVEKITEAIDDLGFNPTLLSIQREDSVQDSYYRRAIQIRIDGLQSPETVQNVMKSMEQLNLSLAGISASAKDALSFVKRPSSKDPILSVKYSPSPPSLSVRQIVSAINAADNNISASVYHPPTEEEQRRKGIRKKLRAYLFRLAVATIIVVPTFIIGIVFMDLVPKENASRRWFEKSIVGKSTRTEWALWVLTTPVMFYSASIFHYNAYKSIKHDWSSRSKTPILRRFYRFGNMDLLISAATAVAYFSSFAIMMMDATSKSMDHSMTRSSDTYFDTVTFLCFFILMGRVLETYTKGRTGDAVANLSSLQPTEASLIEFENEEAVGEEQSQTSVRKIPADQLEVGDVVRIAHGESPPADGMICQDGTFLFNENMLTGESLPAEKVRGDTVYAGTINVSDPVNLLVTKVGGTSMLDQIVEAVQDGQSKRAHADTIAETLTAYFVPVITIIAILTWVIWLGLGLSGTLPKAWLDVAQGGWAFWSLEFAIAVFVVACPCGIGLAAPTAISVGSGMAAKLGILVRGGGLAFEQASNLDSIIFDKTGTLTEGRMTVTNFEVLSNKVEDLDEDLILAISKMLEESSTHPIARAVSEYCVDQGKPVKMESSEIKEISGQGMTGTFKIKGRSNRRYEAVIGNERILKSTKQIPDKESEKGSATSEKADVVLQIKDGSDFFLTQTLQRFQTSGYSTAIVAIRETQNESKTSAIKEDFSPAAIFAIADPIRPEAAEVLQALRSTGISVHMCTGDNPRTAFAIASQLSIPPENVRAGVLPKDKAAYVHEVQYPNSSRDPLQSDNEKGHIVGFVGDGTNDAPALAAANISIALASGSNIAAVSSSFVLLNSNLHTILALIRLAQRVFLRVKLNFAWAAVYNLCLIPAAAGVFLAIGANNTKPGFRLSPVWASLAMALSSISVVLSSLALRLPELRLLKWTGKRKMSP